MVQERLGHSSIQVTYDTYRHLFPRANNPGSFRERNAGCLASSSVSLACPLELQGTSESP